MRVLYITYDGLTDPLGQSQVLPYLLGTAEDGHEITVLSFEKPDRFALLGSDVEPKATAFQLQRITPFQPFQQVVPSHARHRIAGPSALRSSSWSGLPSI